MFDTLFFSFLFLPSALILHWIIPNRFRNFWFLFVSFVFYYWIQPASLPLLFIFIIINYRLGKIIEHSLADPSESKRALKFSIMINLLLITVLKFLAVYLLPLMVFGGVLREDGFRAYLEVAESNSSLFTDAQRNILPLGFSFLFFQTISYFVDIYKRRIVSEKSAANFSLYLAMFPKISAGPITRYIDISQNFHSPQLNISEIREGIRRFTIGMAKKVLVADFLRVGVDNIFWEWLKIWGRMRL